LWGFMYFMYLGPLSVLHYVDNYLREKQNTTPPPPKLQNRDHLLHKFLVNAV